MVHDGVMCRAEQDQIAVTIPLIINQVRVATGAVRTSGDDVGLLTDHCLIGLAGVNQRLPARRKGTPVPSA
jgi:hypothetical protein